MTTARDHSTGGQPVTAALSSGGSGEHRPARGPADITNRLGDSTLYGPSVQAGYIHGGVHFHEAPFVVPTPRQLLPVPAAFTDRVDDLERLTTRLERMPADTVRIAVISGPSGIGKSALASRLLHELGDRFPGGQLYADLRGYAHEGPARPAEILGRFLRSLRPGAQPASVEEMAAWWRSVTAEQSDRPLCILLENVTHADDLRALVPGGRGHVVVATSREQLASLAGDGAVLHRLGPLDPASALDYLTFCLGEERIGRHREAAAQIAGLCAGLPMALALAVTELATYPDRSLAVMTTTLGGSHSRISRSRPSLNRQEAAVTAALDHAYAALPQDAPAARVYRRLGALFVLDIDAPLTAAVCDLSIEDAADQLRLLRSVQLLEPAPAGEELPERGAVYRFHDAARVHARGRAQAEAADGELDEVLRRALDFYLATTTAAELVLTPTHRRIARDYVYPVAQPIAFSEAAALAWLVAQRDNLFAAIRAAHAAGLDTPLYQLAHALWPLLRATHDYSLWFESHSLGLQAARQCGDRAAERELLGTSAVGLRGAGRFDQATEAFTEVLSLARADHDERAEAQALHELGSVCLEVDRLDEAESLLVQARALRETLSRTSEDDLDRRTFQRSVAITDVCRGQVFLKAGRPAEAIEALTSARRTLIAARDPLDAGRALAWLGRAYAQEGDLKAGESYGRHAVSEFDQLGTARWCARSRELLGQTLQADSRLDEVRALYRQAIRLYEQVSRRDARRVRQALRQLA
ncbi:tetratricopeptide repeat protein [Streptomyces sp. NPDC006251]|uniref:tetratricopeptide repeat protein n=1 Tax=Streptomyces sp. NPDC006251 TaxID=3155718 RepID=UPI0033AECA81